MQEAESNGHNKTEEIRRAKMAGKQESNIVENVDIESTVIEDTVRTDHKAQQRPSTKSVDR